MTLEQLIELAAIGASASENNELSIEVAKLRCAQGLSIESRAEIPANSYSAPTKRLYAGIIVRHGHTVDIEAV